MLVSLGPALASGLTLLLGVIGGPLDTLDAADTSPRPDAPRPVTVFALTGRSGEPTEVAVAGLEAVAPATSASPAAFRAAGTTESETTDLAALTPPMEAQEFMVAALTWSGADELAPGTQIFVRVLEDDAWSDWLETGDDEAGPDDADYPSGTEPFVTGGAGAVQVAITGAPSDLPRDLQLSLIPSVPLPAVTTLTEPTASPSEEPPSGSPPATAAEASATPAVVDVAAFTRAAAAPVDAQALAPSAVTRPPIISRSGWGADESLMTWTPTYATLKAAVVHHTAGTNSYTASQSASIVRGIYSYHAVTRGWGDIGYNFLIDKYGQVFEGRSGSLAASATVMPIGAHALNFNTGSMGLSAMGDYSVVNAPQVILDTLARVIAWKFDAAGIDTSTASGFISPGTAYRPAGQALPRIFAHRDVGATVCPGDDVYARLPALRAAVDDLLEPAPEPVQVFADVPAGAAFFADIQWLWEQGITTGAVGPGGARVFGPADSITREAMAAFIYRFMGEPAFTAPTTSPFSDLAPGAAFYPEITWLEAEGIAPGPGDPGGESEFRPTALVTREVMALWLFRALGDPGFLAPAASPFSDVPTTHPAYREISWMHATGISSGAPNGDGTFRYGPADPIRREAMAAFLHRADPLR